MTKYVHRLGEGTNKLKRCYIYFYIYVNTSYHLEIFPPHFSEMGTIPNHPIQDDLIRVLRQEYSKKPLRQDESTTTSGSLRRTFEVLKSVDRILIYSKDYVKIMKLGLFIERFHCERERLGD